MVSWSTFSLQNIYFLYILYDTKFNVTRLEFRRKTPNVGSLTELSRNDAFSTE